MLARHIILSIYFQKTHFIRCIKPNEEKICEKFDNEYVSRQLKSFSVISYAKFVRNCYPIKIPLDSLKEIYDPYFAQIEFFSKNVKQFYIKMLVSCGFRLKNFKMGEKLIFFRECQNGLVSEILNTNPESIKGNLAKMKRFLARNKWKLLINCVTFVNCMLILFIQSFILEKCIFVLIYHHLFICFF